MHFGTIEGKGQVMDMRKYCGMFLETEDASEILEHLVILALTAGVIVLAFSIRAAVSRQASKASARISKITG